MHQPQNLEPCRNIAPVTSDALRRTSRSKTGRVEQDTAAGRLPVNKSALGVLPQSEEQSAPKKSKCHQARVLDFTGPDPRYRMREAF